MLQKQEASISAQRKEFERLEEIMESKAASLNAESRDLKEGQTRLVRKDIELERRQNRLESMQGRLSKRHSEIIEKEAALKKESKKCRAHSWQRKGNSQGMKRMSGPGWQRR
ncbi:hypothetical protein J4475_03790 [Candidatus Woesearchaeota archaeon]|nr:hypothetical protein [Candidatus Woesearchaeota archaeon]